MRQKMLDAHPNLDAKISFDLKHDRGGIIDVEFMVQYLVLGYAHPHPQLTANIGNIALLLHAAELQLIPTEAAAAVAHAYRELRRMQHKLRLSAAEDTQQFARIPISQLQTEREAVLALWQQLLGE